MKTTTVSVLVSIAVALFAYIVLVERHQLTDIELQGRGARLIERFAQRRVEGVVIERGGERIELVASNRPGDESAEEGRSWDMRAPLEARADTGAVAALLGALEWAEPRRKFEGVERDELAGYGLIDPAVRVTLRIAGETVTLSIGNPDATDAGRYAMLDDPAVVYVVGDDLFEAADHDAEHFRNREVFPDVMLEMNDITLRRGDAVTRVERDVSASDETWHLREPLAMLASAQRVRDIKRAISSLNATRFAGEAERLGDVYFRFESQAKARENAPYTPVVLVVGMRLGCLNHALLTAESIALRQLPWSGWVGNQVDPAMAYPAENVAALHARLPGPCLGVQAYLPLDTPSVDVESWLTLPKELASWGLAIN